MMVIVTVAKTNNENADPQVHICAAPTLKSSWEGVLQVSVNKYFVQNQIKSFVCESFSVPTQHPRNLKLISSATVGRGGLHTEVLFYTLQPVYSSSSGSVPPPRTQPAQTPPRRPPTQTRPTPPPHPPTHRLSSTPTSL